MTDKTTYQTFIDQVRLRGTAIAISDEGVDISFDNLAKSSRVVARALMADGIGKGDRVAIWANNRYEWIIADLAIQAAGAIMIPLGTRLRASEVASVLERADVRILFSDGGFGDYDFITAIRAQNLPGLRRVVCFDRDDADATGFAQFQELAGSTSEDILDARIAAGKPDDILDILFTSGTTGAPKAVPMTHRQSLFSIGHQEREVYRFQPGDATCVVFPFAHVAGYRCGWLVALINGVRVVPVRNYDPSYLLELYAREKPSYVPAAPPIFWSMIKHPDHGKYDFSSVRVASTGGGDVTVDLISSIRTKLGMGNVLNSYGMTESAGSMTANYKGDTDHQVAHTVGRPLPGVDIKCVDETFQAVPIGESGEIVARGPQLLKEYWNNPTATADAFTPDGYFRTGDIGAFDTDGNLRLTGRLKDMYRVGGFNCYPAEIENMLRGIDGVADAAVIGVPDERLSEVGRAFVILEPGAALDEAAIITWSRDNMANYKVPRSVIFVSDFPRNAQGKVAKLELKAPG